MKFYKIFFWYMMYVQILMFWITLWSYGHVSSQDNGHVNASVDTQMSKEMNSSLINLWLNKNMNVSNSLIKNNLNMSKSHINQNLKELVLFRLRQEKHVEGRECASGFMALSTPENTFANWKKRDTPRKIVVMSPYDCEVDMLLFKLEEMGPWMDHFVIVESSVSNSNRARTMCFDKSQVAESTHAEKIIYMESHESVPKFNYWEQEVYVKNQLGLPLVELGLKEDDLVMMMDMDEVIAGRNLEMLKTFDHPQGHTAFKISLRWSYYGFEWVNPDTTAVNSVVSWLEFKTACDLKANAVRYNLCELAGGELLAMVGWHCSWCFVDTGQFIAKIEKSSKREDHKEYKNLDFLQEQREKGLWFVDGMPNGCDLVNKFN